MKKTLLFLTIVVFAITSMAATDVKIAVVDFQKIFSSYSKTQDAYETLQLEKTKKQEELTKQETDLKAKKDEMEDDKKKGVITEEEYKKRENDLKVEIIGLQRKLNTFNKEIQEMEKQFMEDIKLEIEKEIEKIAKRKKYTHVLEKTVVFFGAEDITDEVIKELNK